MLSFNLTVPCVAKTVEIVATDDTTLAGRSGYDAGFQAGYSAGLLQAGREARLVREEWKGEVQKALDTLHKLHEKMFQTVGSHMPELILTVLNRLFEHHSFAPEEIESEIRALISELALAKTISIECSPEDLATLRDRIESTTVSLTQGQLKWMGNPDLKRGEFILRSDLGLLDGRRATRLAQVQTALQPLL